MQSVAKLNWMQFSELKLNTEGKWKQKQPRTAEMSFCWITDENLMKLLGGYFSKHSFPNSELQF